MTAGAHNGPPSGPAGPVGPDGPQRPAPADGSVEVIDCRGQRCPLPVIAVARRLPDLPVGAVVRVLADDPAAAIDIPAWCRMRGQELVGTTTVAGAPAYDVRRRH